jgi:hypothetical protein
MRALTTAFSLVIPRVLGRGIDTVLSSGQRSAIIIAAVIIVVSSALRGVSAYGNRYLNQVISQRVSYDIRNTISATRGCPHACAFCSISSFFGHTYRCRPVEEIVREIETLDRREPVVFVDDNIVGDPRFVAHLDGPVKILRRQRFSERIILNDRVQKWAGGYCSQTIEDILYNLLPVCGISEGLANTFVLEKRVF